MSHSEKVAKYNKQYSKSHPEVRSRINKKYRETHREEIKKYNKQYSKLRPEINRKKSATYRIKHPETVARCQAEYDHAKYMRDRRSRDAEFKLIGNLRHRLSEALRNNCKKDKTLDYLGCSVGQLKHYLESQFTEGMSWDNYGNKEGCWSIDHIRPCSKFDLTKEEEIYKMCHYTNLRPMWHIENIKKGARYPAI